MKSFRDLDIYKMSYKLAIKVHHITLKLPNYELYEQGSQLRRSSKRIKDTIAEGIAIADPIRGKQIVEAVEKSHGDFIVVDDSEIKDSDIVSDKMDKLIDLLGVE